jgi:kynurenine formamidase
MRIVDLSVALKAGIASDPPSMLPRIKYLDHRDGAKEFMAWFPGLKAEQLPDGEGAAMEEITLSTHNGTHLDAPWHFASTQDGGKPALKIDEVPLDWFFSSGVKLDFRQKPDGYVCQADDVKRELDRIGYALKPLDIVLVNTGAATFYGAPNYLAKAAAWAARRRFICSAKACASPASTAGAGTRRSRSRTNASSKPATPASSGKATKPAARSATATWKSSPTSTSCHRSASRWRASR